MPALPLATIEDGRYRENFSYVAEMDKTPLAVTKNVQNCVPLWDVGLLLSMFPITFLG